MEVYVGNNKVVDVVKMFPDLRFGHPAGHTAHDEVSCCASSDFVCDMGWNLELTISPAEIKLQSISIQSKRQVWDSTARTRLACR